MSTVAKDGKRGDAAPEVVVVDDEEHLREMVAEYLDADGFRVRTASGGAALDVLLREREADLLVLDLNMPGEDGLSIMRRLRAGPPMPVLVLTAASDLTDKVVGLEVGADDYLTKPFHLSELKARVRALLRRPWRAHPPSSPVAPAPDGAALVGLTPVGTKYLDLGTRCLVDPNGRSEALTPMEFDLIQTFLHNPDRVLTRERLLDLDHKRRGEPFDRSIDVRVTRIRRKIEEDPANPQVIRTVRGAGYIYKPAKGTM